MGLSARTSRMTRWNLSLLMALFLFGCGVEEVPPAKLEQIKALPRNSIIAFRVDDKAEVEQLFKRQRVFSGEGFSSFAIVDGKDALTPVFFHGFAEKPVAGDGRCHTLLLTTNAVIHLAEFRNGIGENAIPQLPCQSQSANLHGLEVGIPVEIVCQGSVQMRILMDVLRQINPDGVKDIYLLHY